MTRYMPEIGCDRIWCKYGNDLLNGGGENDTVSRGSGQDTIVGGMGTASTRRGDDGNDRL